MSAIWNGKILAESNNTLSLEGNIYFPMNAANKAYLVESNTHTRCIWKGKANYYHVVVYGKTNTDAAWFYPKPSLLAKKITGYIAFWRGVEISA